MASRVKSITFVREFGSEDKLPPQAKGIVESAIAAHGLGTALTSDQIVEAMEGNIETKQPLSRILGFYVPRLEKEGFIEVERGASAENKSKDEDGETASDDMDEEDDDIDEDDEDLEDA